MARRRLRARAAHVCVRLLLRHLLLEVFDASLLPFELLHEGSDDGGDAPFELEIRIVGLVVVGVIIVGLIVVRHRRTAASLVSLRPL